MMFRCEGSLLTTLKPNEMAGENGHVAKSGHANDLGLRREAGSAQQPYDKFELAAHC